MNYSTTFDFLNDCDQGKNFMREVVEKAINNLLLTDFLDFVADPSKDGEAVIKNGFYTRTFNTGIGAIRVNVPRDRANLYRNQLPPYRHSLDSLCQDILALYRKDMTHSEIREFLQAETGYSFSENTIQKIVHKAYGEYQEFMSHPLEDFLFNLLKEPTWFIAFLFVYKEPEKSF